MVILAAPPAGPDLAAALIPDHPLIPALDFLLVALAKAAHAVCAGAPMLLPIPTCQILAGRTAILSQPR
jgi:hypothetical protein